MSNEDEDEDDWFSFKCRESKIFKKIFEQNNQGIKGKVKRMQKEKGKSFKTKKIQLKRNI